MVIEEINKKLKNIEENNSKYNIFLNVDKASIIERAEELEKKKNSGEGLGKLFGKFIGVKSNISIKGLPITCGSKTLQNYLGTFDADVIKKINEEDGIIIGLTNCDEFASGSSGEYSAFGPTENPKAHGRIPGGSSSGSAASVAADFCDIALGSDTGGSIRNPASHCGVIGVKPSYGRVSRYGLIDLAMSFDQIGPLSNNVMDAALMMEVISGRSENDATTFDEDVPKYSEFSIDKIGDSIKFGFVDELKELIKDKEIEHLIIKRMEQFSVFLSEKGVSSSPEIINSPHLKLAVSSYYPIVYTEFYSGTRKFDGRKYGSAIEESCGEEVLRRILGGKEISKAEHGGKYYRKALSVKKLIAKEFEENFEKVDFIISPVTPRLPHKLGEEVSPEEMYAYDAFTVPANLAGICAASFPIGHIDLGFHKIPVGLQIMAPAFSEDKLFTLLFLLEEFMNSKHMN